MLEAIQAEGYRIGDLQAIIYDRNDHSVFEEGFLARLYFMLRGDRYSKREGDGILSALFCGMQDLSFDAIVAYLSTRPLCLMGEWKDGKFDVAGLCFAVTMIGSGKGNPKACFCGYGFKRESWGTENLETLALLGITVLFQEMDVLSIHGVRYASNDLTARFMGKFGFKDVGTIPRYMLRRGALVDATVSTLSRETFEWNVGERMLAAYEKKNKS